MLVLPVVVAVLGACWPLVQAFAACPNPDSPGVLLGITQPGLNTVAKIGVELLQKTLSGLAIPDRRYGGFHLTHISLNKFDIGQYSLRTIWGGLKPSVTVHANASFNYDGCKEIFGFRICDTGKASLRGTISIEMVANVKVESKRYVLSLGHCSASVSNFKLSVTEGKWKELLNGGLLDEQMIEAMKRLICPQVTEYIKSKGNAALNSFSTKAQIYKNIYVDYSLMGSVIAGHAFVISKLKGRVYGHMVHATPPPTTRVSAASTASRHHRHHSPARHQVIRQQAAVAAAAAASLCPRPLPVVPEKGSSCPYYIRASDYLFRTGMNVVYTSGYLQQPLCLPSKLSPVLETITKLGQSAKACVPPQELGLKHPGGACKSFVYLKATQAPTVTISSKGVQMDLKFSVELLLSNKCSVCVITGTASAAGDLSVNTTGDKHTVKGKINTLHIRESTLCPFLKSRFIESIIRTQHGISSIASYLTHIANTVAQPRINAILNQGFPLPELKHIALHHPSLHLNEGYGTMCFNVEYKDKA